MNGVEVLNTIPGGKLNVVFVALAVLCFVDAVVCFSDKSEFRWIVSTLLAIACIYFCVPQKTQYRVTISDNISFKEFNKKYEVIKQEGDIFIVEMRENDD